MNKKYIVNLNIYTASIKLARRFVERLSKYARSLMSLFVVALVIILFLMVRFSILVLLEKVLLDWDVADKYGNLASIIAFLITVIFIRIIGFNTRRIKWGEEGSRLRLSFSTRECSTKMDNEVLDDFCLSWKEKIVFITLLRFSYKKIDSPDSNNPDRLLCALPRDKIAEYAEMWGWVVEYLLRKLEKKGYIKSSFTTSCAPEWWQEGTINCYEIIQKGKRNNGTKKMDKDIKNEEIPQKKI